ncbi:sensor histidine kinase [Streptomyces sp. MI02-7b]|uniref:sensor histidine kinase n=1 Tax=Streptomyces sp. MI02-7b TaxID=462941 RepID=UPI0029B741C0|nr:sensor histidine kinase [Streptomyces sp. MI02-7b]MDX3072103.1 sensor histidine kinase [Streptomyces sp. MI02-7b]
MGGARLIARQVRESPLELRGWQGGIFDAVLGLVLVADVLLLPGVPAPADALDLVLALVGALAVTGSRRAPLSALLLCTGCMLAYALRVHPGPTAAFPVLVAVHIAVRTGGRRLPVKVAVLAFLGGYLASGQPAPTAAQSTALLLGWFLASVAMAVVGRHRRAYLEQLERRALEAERTREEAALRRAGEERLRIARELHDSLTHSISIIKLQAGVAVHLARKRGEEAPEALLAIQEASGEAMRELRATLEVLRGSGGGHGVDRIGDLAERSRTAGLPTSVTVSGRERPLADGVDRAAYRIVQEALTNVTRHAGPRPRATVRIEYADRQLVVQVDDDGTAAPDAEPVPGVGLTGMRERVTALGGRLRAGPRPEGGFTVRAELPLEAAT